MANKKNDDYETPEQCYYRHLSAKTDNAPWIRDIDVDMSTIWAKDGRCLYCGNPNMEDCFDAGTCKVCAVQRLIRMNGISREAAEKIYNLRIKGKELSLRNEEYLREQKNKRMGVNNGREQA